MTLKMSIITSLNSFHENNTETGSFTALILTDEARAEAGGVGSHQLGGQLPVLTGREQTSLFSTQEQQHISYSLFCHGSTHLSQELRGPLWTRGHRGPLSHWSLLEPDTHTQS